jgi:hypothetical protein
MVLRETVEYIRKLQAERKILAEQMELRGLPVPSDALDEEEEEEI